MIMPNSKTITTYLVEWDPLGIKTIELSNWIWKGIIIPRNKLKEVRNRSEIHQPAVYFLFGEDEDGTKKVYVWESEKLIDRIFSHENNKDWRNIVIAFVSKDNNLTKSDIKYLEHMSVKKAKEVGRFKLENKTIPEKNVLPEYRESEMQEFLDNLDLLISTAGFPVFKPLYDRKINEKNLFYIKSKWANAKWIYGEEGFVVLKGSKWSLNLAPSFESKAKSYFKLREKLLEEWKLKIVGNYVVFEKDLNFPSPSSAAAVVLGRSANWWTEWKNKEGKTLDEMYRK